MIPVRIETLSRQSIVQRGRLDQPAREKWRAALSMEIFSDEETETGQRDVSRALSPAVGTGSARVVECQEQQTSGRK